MSEKQENRAGVGASSILMIVVVLALTAMSLLAFSSAQRTETLEKRNQEMSLGYYAAAAQAQTKLAALDQRLYELRGEQGLSDQEYADALISMAGYGVTATADGFGFTFIVDAQYGRELCVSGLIAARGAQGERYTLTRHELIGHAMDDESTYYDLIGD